MKRLDNCIDMRPHNIKRLVRITAQKYLEMKQIIHIIVFSILALPVFAVEDTRNLAGDLQTTKKQTPALPNSRRAIFDHVTSTTLTIEDKLFNVSPQTMVQATRSKVEVSLRLKDPGKKYNTTFDYKLPIRIALWRNNASSPDVYYTTLKVFYSQVNANNNNKLFSAFTADNYYKASVSQVTTTTRPSHTIANLQADNVELEFDIKITAYRTYVVSSILANGTYSYVKDAFETPILYDMSEGNSARITISNLFKNGSSPYSGISDADALWIKPDEYDLEWAFIDFNSSMAAPMKPFKTATSTFNYDFTNIQNLTYSRVNLKKELVFNIPLIYNEGFIVYRIRPVTYSALGDRQEFEWQYQNVNSSGNTTYNIFYVKPHQSNLNWSSSISFAEDGKRKAAVSYFDGTQRERQSVSSNTTNNIAFVSESFYDFEGRKAISTLPAPKLLNTTSTFSVPGNTIKFYSGFSLNDQDKSIKEADFNINPPNGCLPLPSKSMSLSSGASQYYSSNNFLHANSKVPDRYLNYWLPNANLYPYVQTKYTNDGTNRVLTQSGVGSVHRLASGHETKNFYTNINSQEELDRLFGTEVGNHMYYDKTYTEDPNGQTSVTYQDMKGRTIATALIGNHPGALSPLTSGVLNNTSDYNPSAPMKYNFIHSGNLTKQETWFKTMYGVSTHFVPISNERIDFKLNFNTSGYNQNLCLSKPPACIDCYYDISVKVTDNCGNPVLITKSDGSTSNELEISNYTKEPKIDFICNNNIPAPRPNIVDHEFSTIAMAKGNYVVSAQASVPEKYADIYTRKYMDEMEKCPEYDLQKMIDDKIAAIDPFSCIKDCQQCEAEVAKGYAVYKIRVQNQLMKVRDQFPIDPNPAFGNFVQSTASKQWADLQAKCNKMCDGKYKSECQFYKESLLSDVGMGGQYGYKFTTGGAKIAEEPSVLYAAIGHPDMKKPDGSDLANIDEVLAHWKDEWREQLVFYHPEYCYYQNCLANEGVSVDFEKALDKATTIDCDILTNTDYDYGSPTGNKLLKLLKRPANFNWTSFINQYDNFNFFSTSTTAPFVPRPLKEMAFIMAFGRYPEFDITTTASASKLYSLNNFKGIVSSSGSIIATANPCLNGYCEADRALYWHHYKTLLKSLVDMVKANTMVPVTTPIGSAPDRACVKNEYIACFKTSPASSGKNLSQYGGVFDNLFKGEYDATRPPCPLHSTTIILRFKSDLTGGIKEFTGQEFNNKRRIFPDMQKFISKFTDELNLCKVLTMGRLHQVIFPMNLNFTYVKNNLMAG
jgi:hypothetical protein